MTKTTIFISIFFISFIFLPYLVTADTSDLVVMMNTHNVPVIIQAKGGNVDYSIEVVNNGVTSLNFDVWTGLTLPNGVVKSPIFGPEIFILPGGWTTNRPFSQYVPSHYLPGNYTYTVFVGIYPGTIWTADNFQFEKETESESMGWTQQNYDNPYPVLQSVFFTDPNNGWIVGSRNEIIHTSDGGDNWYNQVSPTSSN